MTPQKRRPDFQYKSLNLKIKHISSRSCFVIWYKSTLKIKMKLSSPHDNRNDITSITSVMRTGWISTSAKVVNDFEKRLSKFCQTKCLSCFKFW